MKKTRLIYIIALLLMAAMGGVKAENLAVTSEDIGKVLCTDGNIYEAGAVPYGKYAVAMIAFVDEQNHKGLAIALEDVYYVENQSYYGSFQWADAEDELAKWAADKTVAGATWKVPSIVEWQQMLIGCGAEGVVEEEPSYESQLSFIPINEKLVAAYQYGDLDSWYWSSDESTYTNEYAQVVGLSSYNENIYAKFSNGQKVSEYVIRACLAFDLEGASQPVEMTEGLAITKDDIGKFICPDGTLSDTYKWSDINVDGKITIAMIAYVDEASHKALAMPTIDPQPPGCAKWADAEGKIRDWAEGLSAKEKLTNEYLKWKLPTIQDWQQMFIGCGANATVTDDPVLGSTISYSELDALMTAGNSSFGVFREYYVYWSATDYAYDADYAWCLGFSDSGTATFHRVGKTEDTDFNPAVFPCLEITVATEVTPEPEPLCLEVTEANVGWLVYPDGTIYAPTDENKPANETPVGMIAAVDMESETGLVIALEDETDQVYSTNYLDWATATAKAAAHTAIAGTTWKLPSQEEWQQMLEYDYGYYSTSLNSMLTAAGGTALNSYGYTNQGNLYSNYYWTSTTEEDDEYDHKVMYAAFSNDYCFFTSTYWNDTDYHPLGYARACFTFNVKIKKYSITVDNYYASYVQLHKTEAVEGETVGLTITNIPNGQYVEYVSVVKADDSSESLNTYRSYDNENVWTFTMPAYPVTVDWVYFKDVEQTKEIAGLYYTFYNQSRTAEVAPHPSNGYSGNIVIPETVPYSQYENYRVTAIGENAFAGYSNNEITSVTCGSNIKTIRRDAFYQTTMTGAGTGGYTPPVHSSRRSNNSAQQGLTMNEGLTTIEQYAFRESNFDIEIPASVNSISRWAFKGYKGTKMSVREGNTTYDSREGCNAIIEKSQQFMVSENNFVEKATIVAGCIASTFPTTVEAIGEAAFDGVGLTSVNIPSTIKILDTGAFANNPLTSIFIPKTVEEIYTNPLYGCNQLQTIVVEEGNPNYDSREGCNAIIDTKKNWLMASSKGTVIPTSVTCISTHAFAYRDDLNEYKVPKHITAINDNAFAYSNLYNISLEDNNELSLGIWAFQGCKELRTVKIGRGIKYLAKEVFRGCPNLKSVYVNAPLVPEVKNTTEEQTFLKDDAGNLIDATVYVPATSLSTYKKIAPWKNLNLAAATGLQGVTAKFGQIGLGSGSGSGSARGMRKAVGEGVDLITEEGTVWRATGAGENAFSINGSGELQIDASATVTLSNRSDMDFVISGPVKEIEVRATGINSISCDIIDIAQNPDNDMADTENSATLTSGTNKYTFAFSGKAYAKAKVKLTIGITGTARISGISIVQGGGDYVITDEASVTVKGIEYSNSLSAPASVQDAEAIVDGQPVYVYTTCLPTPPEQSAGLKFYTLSNSTETSLQFVEIDGAPQANTPYLVAVSSDTEIGVSIGGEVTLKKEADNTQNIGAYKFVGTTTGLTNAEAAAQHAYILQDGNFWGEVTTENYEAYIPPFRAYIVPADPASARSLLRGGFSSEADTPVAISTMQLTDRDGTTRCYDLSGRPVAKPSGSGVYVVNGKKVLIKK